MLSRVAHSIYWMSRYIERAENIARFIDVNLILLLDMQESNVEQWVPLVKITGDYDYFLMRYGEVNRDNVMEFLTFDKNYPNSIISCIYNARENARSIREVIPSEIWEHLNTFYLSLKEISSIHKAMENPHDFYTDVKMASHLHVGIENSTMSYNDGWNFARLGRLLERADKTTRLIDVKYFILLPTVRHIGTSIDDIQWAALLKSASAFEMYRKNYQKITPNKIVDFLLLNREFPRSVHHCLIMADQSLHSLTGTPDGMFSNKAEQALGFLRSELAYSEVDDIISKGLHEFLDALQVKLNKIDDNIFENYFSLRPMENQTIEQ